MKFYLSFGKNGHQSKTLRRLLHSTKLCRTTQSFFPEQHVEIRTCGNLYKKWKQEKKHWTVPNTELTFQVPFIDTHRDEDECYQPSKPIILALHGAPGSYNDFNLLTTHLYNHGIRVIAPSFPDILAYKPGTFRHSSEERAQFLRDFLKAINISKIDLIICHSSSVYVGLILCLEKMELNIRSMAMLNPGVHRYRSRIFSLMMSYMVKGSEFAIFLNFLKHFGPFIFKHIVKLPVRVDNYLDPLLSATVMTNADITKTKHRLQELSSQNFPFLFAFSENDKLIDKDLSYQMSSLIGAQKSDIQYIDKNGVVTNEGNENPNLKVMVFENGSHYVFWKYPGIINEAITQFVTKQCIK